MPTIEFIGPLMEWILFPLFRIAIIIIGAWGLARLSKPVLERLEPFIVKARHKDEAKGEAEKRAKTLTQIVWHIARVTIGVVAIIMVLGQLGLQIGPILAGLGMVGLAVGFGAQNMVKDVINGFFLLMENHYRVGDVVRMAGVAGLVEAVNLRVTILRDLQGRVHVIPNGHFEVLTNFTKDWSRALLDIGVAYKEDVDEVMAVLEEVGEELRQDKDFKELIMEPLNILGVEDFGESEVTIRMFFKTQPLKQWDVSREFRRRVKKAFDEKGIEIPFPHRTIYMGVPEEQGHLFVEQVPAGGKAGE
ncbi:MAG: mechanosensitive ion channel family protein [Nitrospinae bacterium]|nr:mechanosensitive ion channel family protein [Nitrospinota bacterium]MCH7768142.1 mechanosensitive ion channel family protein [Nitrospinota bacterium]